MVAISVDNDWSEPGAYFCDFDAVQILLIGNSITGIYFKYSFLYAIIFVQIHVHVFIQIISVCKK